jgi:hypothetical protein
MTIQGDRPVVVGSEDRLGFTALAQRLAPALVDQASSDGLVIGIEGKWGSGKSSLLNLTVQALETLPAETKPIIVPFQPWLIGDRDALLTSLFADMANAIEAAEKEKGFSKTEQRREARAAAEKIRAFAANAEVLGAALAFVPGTGAVANGLKALGTSAKKLDLKVPLRKRKGEIEDALGLLSRRIIVTIDDVDRLEPIEALELMRLVRSVADFQNVIYVMCFDQQVLAQNIETAAKVKSGAAFLEKIVQVTVSVPTPEAFVLRRWFAAELAEFAALPESGNVSSGSDVGRRLINVIDSEGGRRLRRPRDVGRALNALRLVWPALKDAVDLADLVWLKLVQVSSPDLHRWIESYSTTAASASSWRVSVPDEDKQREFDGLNDILTDEGMTFAEVEGSFRNILPGFQSMHPGQSGVPIFGRVNRQAMQVAIDGRRIASPDHYRLYFALAEPAMAVKEIDFARLVAATSDSIKATALLLMEWMSDVDATVGSRADVVLDRLNNDRKWRLSQAQSETLLSALSNVLDEAIALSPTADFGPSTWSEAERLLRRIRQEFISAAQKMTAKAFGRGQAIAWLTSVLRHETLAHGRVDKKQTTPQRDWMMSEVELNTISRTMCKRYSRMTYADWTSVPRPLSMLFAWFQAGGEDDARTFVLNHIKSDEGLIEILELIIGRQRTSDGEFIMLSKTNIGPFLPYEEVRSRVESISKKKGDAGERARNLAERFKTADSF